jgi:hypothetical protein
MAISICGSRAEEGTNLLLLNEGTGVFSDASDRLPRDVHDHEDIAVAEFDNDGDLDARPTRAATSSCCTDSSPRLSQRSTAHSLSA